MDTALTSRLCQRSVGKGRGGPGPGSGSGVTTVSKQCVNNINQINIQLCGVGSVVGERKEDSEK